MVMAIQLQVIFLLISYLTSQLAEAQNGTDSDPNTIRPLHPGILWVIGVVSAVLSMTFLVLAYAKLCQRYPLDIVELEGNHNNLRPESGRGSRSARTTSGFDQAVIDSLPFFNFSSLKGWRRGLECAVCLSRFEETEVLRLLPKCKHAFHRTCIDKWLLGHSSCPLCRSKIDPRDIEGFNSSRSLSYSGALSNLTNEPDLEIFIERDQRNRHGGSSRFSFNIGSISFGDKRRRQQELVVEVRNSTNGGSSDVTKKVFHKLKHKVIVSDVVIKNRWSDVNSSDLLSLSSDMLGDMSTRKMSAPVDLESADSDIHIDGVGRTNSVSSYIDHLDDQMSRMINHNRVEKRSMSEITHFSRLESGYLRGVQGFRLEHSGSKKYAREERIRRLWVPIAKRTVHWLASRENKFQEYKKQIPEV